MGMLDGLLGGIVGAGMVSVVNNIIEKHGGLQGVVSEFEKSGLGTTVKSWVGTGPNQPISPDEVQKVLGPDLLQQLSAEIRLVGAGSDTEAIAGAAPGRGQADAERHDPDGLARLKGRVSVLRAPASPAAACAPTPARRRESPSPRDCCRATTAH